MAATTLPVDIDARPFAATGEAANLRAMALDPAQLPDDVATLKAMLIASTARVATAEARALDLDAQIAHLKLMIAKEPLNNPPNMAH